jgi:double-strand break repair protein MRE11
MEIMTILQAYVYDDTSYKHDTNELQEGHLAALDILQMSGLVNYYGRTPEADNIHVKPVLLQKGNTKLALYGMSNVRDERLNHTFKDGKVKFFRPGTQKDDWFNILSIHQNHHAYTENGYIPEHFLPDFLDLVVWGHEHECLIEPRTNQETNFRVMQPGSSVATSLVPGEAVEKKVAILSIKGKEFDMEPIRLKTVRPFIYKEIALQDSKRMCAVAYDSDNKPKVHAYLTEIIGGLIEDAKQMWLDQQRESNEEPDEPLTPPLPLIRLRVEYTAPEGGEFHIDNAQRFSNRFNDQVANVSDVVQFHRKRVTARTTKAKADMPEDQVMAQLSLDSVKVSKLVEEFLTAQSLSILPQNGFSDAVGQYIDKEDKHEIEDFIRDSMAHFNKELLAGDDEDVNEVDNMMEQIKESLEKAFAKGELKSKRKGRRKPKPDMWDSDDMGHWVDNPASRYREEEDEEQEDDDDEESGAPKKKTAERGRGRGRGGKAAATSTRKTTAAAKKAPAKKTTTRGKKTQVISDDDEEDSDEMMVDVDDNEEDEESESLFVRPANKAAAARASKATAASRAAKSPATKTSARGGKTPASSTRQSQLNFSSQANGSGPARAVGSRAAAPRRLQEPSEDEISDDDAFEPPPSAATRSARGGRR